MSRTAPQDAPPREELAIGGMSCAACAARIEKRLNRIDGVTATVNYATGRASVSAPAEVTLADITETVEKLGYTATTAAGIDDGHARDGLRPRLIAALVLGLPVLVMSMVPGAQFRGWQWLSLVLVTPVVTWSAWPIHAAALKHLNMLERYPEEAGADQPAEHGVRRTGRESLEPREQVPGDRTREAGQQHHQQVVAAVHQQLGAG